MTSPSNRGMIHDMSGDHAPAIQPISIRSSLVRCFMSGCPLRWRLDEQALEEGRAVEASWNVMGTQIHDAIHHFINNPEITAADVYAYLNDGLEIFDWDEMIYSSKRPTKEAVFEAAEACLTNFFMLWLTPNGRAQLAGVEDPDDVLDIEPMATEETLSVELRDGLVVESTPDMVAKVTTRVGTSYHVFDWKTGVSTSADPTQLHIYRWLVRRTSLVPEDEPLVGTFVYLTPGKVKHYSIYPGDGVVECLIESAGLHVANNLWYPRPAWYCQACPHSPVCPALVGAEPVVASRQDEDQ